MKVGRSGGPATASPQAGAARAPASGQAFSLPGAGQAAGAAPMSASVGLAGMAGLDALIALQAAGDPLERRRRSVGRAGRILDVLDGLKLAMLDGRVPASSLDRLMRAVREERAATEDSRLEGLLDEIETRAQVELAKLQRAKLAA